MNQILSNKFIDLDTNNSNLKKLKIIFWISISIISICIIVFIVFRYNFMQKQKIAKSLENKFEIRSLYSGASSNYNTQKINTPATNPFVIGLLKIEKINLLYPILSTTTDELLKISPCRFYGPMPNEIGNLCIAGHNYANQTHFAKLNYLDNKDTIQIFDLNGNKVDYTIYSKDELPANNTSCLSQDTNNVRELTLVTCNTIKGNRLVIKAKETAF